MTSPTLPVELSADLLKKRYKMVLRQTEAMVTGSGFQRYPAGAVLLVDGETAARWYEHNVAEIAPADAETYGEILRRVKREEFLKRAQAVGGTFDAMVTRASSAPATGQEQQLMPPPMPIPPRRGRPRRDPALEGAGVINALDDEDEV